MTATARTSDRLSDLGLVEAPSVRLIGFGVFGGRPSVVYSGVVQAEMVGRLSVSECSEVASTKC